MTKKINIKKDIIIAYIDLYKNLKGCNLVDLKSYGYTKDQIKHHFGSLQNLDKTARKEYPKKFEDILIEDLITTKSKRRLNASIKKGNRFFITTTVTNCVPEKKSLKTLRAYCKKNKVELLLLACSDPAHNLNKGLKGYGTISREFKDDLLVTNEIALNSNFFISTIKTTAKQIDPTTGLTRIGQRDGSFVYASPKQRLRVDSTSNNKMPHCIMTTGAITKPNYTSEYYMSQRLAYIAEHDHKIGGIIVEIVDDKKYHFRQVQFDEKGRFVDLGMMYDGDRSYKYSPKAIVLGDWHSGDTDPIVAQTTFKMIKDLKPNEVIIHDGFNGKSINHHEDKDIILKSLRSDKDELNLKQEIINFSKDLNKFSKVLNKVVLVESNHNEFLSRYLSECRFKDDPKNLKISLELALAMTDRLNPLKYGIEKYGKINNKKIVFLNRDEDYLIAGIQCGAHGDKGSNGARGSLKSSENSYGKCVVGHSHTPGILRDAWGVGTSTYLKLGYNLGPSSWLNTHCLVYPNGMRQLINIINGDYKL